MANQMIALQARGAQLPDPSRLTAQYANMTNMTAQRRAAERQGMQAQQAMDIKAAEEARAAELQPFKITEAQSKANSERLKYVMDYFETSALALSNARNPQQAVALGGRMKQMFPEPQLQQAIDETLASIPQDPGQFQAWREDSLMRTMDAKDQLAQEFQKQTTGTEERILSMPKYGRGAATEVPGSRIQVAEGMQYITGADGAKYAVPTKIGGSFDTTAPAGAPGKGSPVANALKTNPGALKDGPFARKQPGYVGSSGGFATFDTPQAGITAQENLLRGSYINKGFNTVDKIINRYAPQGSENSAASVNNYKKYVAQKAGVDINAPISAAQIPAVAKAMREFETGNKSGGGAAAAAPGGLTPILPGKPPAPAKPKPGEITPEAKLARDTAVQDLYNAIVDAQKKGHLTSESKSFVGNRAQELLRGRTYLPGGTAQKTSLDDIDTAATQLLRLFIQKGTSGTLNTKAEQENFMRSVGGADASYETRLKTIRNFAKQNGIPLAETAATKPKATTTRTPVPRKASGGFTVVRVED